MTEEEKKAIEFLKEKMKNWRKYMPEDKELHAEDIVINLIQKQDTEINKLNKRISDLEFALIDMVYQFADESKNQLNTMGLSALETAFCELDFDDPIDKDIVIKKFEELYKKYINNK